MKCHKLLVNFPGNIPDSSQPAILPISIFKRSSASRFRHKLLAPRLRQVFESENEKNKDSINAIVDQHSQGYVGTARDTSYTNVGVGASLVLKNGLQLFGFFESHLQHDFVTQNWIKLGGRLAF